MALIARRCDIGGGWSITPSTILHLELGLSRQNSQLRNEREEKSGESQPLGADIFDTGLCYFTPRVIEITPITGVMGPYL